MKKIFYPLFFWVLFTGGVFCETKLDSKGTDFWLTYLPNFHNNISDADPEIKFGDSLFIFINSDAPATGRIDYIDRFGISHYQNFTISDPNQMYTFKLSFYDYELWGYNYSSKNWSNFQTDKIAPQSFHITSDVEVTVYAHNQAVTTSDAMLVLPTDVLGNEYYVMSYNSDGRTELDQFSRTPSQFAVVATEDNTTVKITNKIASYLNPPGTRTVILNKGNSYLVQAKFDEGILNPDLTGSHILSDKPVAVFGGHQRSTIPVTTTNSNPSRDCLLEQIPPINTWGKNAIVIPPKEPDDPMSIPGSLYRVLACMDSTQIFVNGINKPLLNKGEFYSDEILTPKEVTSNKPILIGVFKYTAGQAGTTFPLGDPFMMLIPPREQFLKSCKVNNIQAWEKNPGDNLFYPVYYEQYITIVAQSNALDSIYIDNVKLLPSDFSPVSSGEYSYSHVQVGDGVHYVSSKEPVGVYIYGYGRANSFGYIGGMDFKKINYDPPVISLVDTCYETRGTITTADTSLKLKDVNFMVDSTYNVNVNISDFTGKSRTNFFVALVNYRLDGRTIINATDSENRIAEKEINIPGLTLSSWSNAFSDSIPKFIIQANPDAMESVKLWNYGKYLQTIADVKLKISDVGSVSSFPASIPAGNNDSVIVNFSVNDDVTHYDTLFAVTKCGELILATFTVTRSACDISAFEYNGFVSREGLALNGRAYPADTYIRLTDADRYRTGSLWYQETVPVLDGFSTEFKFRFTSGNNFQCEDGSIPGADGIAFVIQNAGKAALGYAGGSIGYEGIYNSLAIEFDTFSNDSTQIEDYHDPNGNHVAVNTNGIKENSAKHLPGITLGINKDIMKFKIDSTFYFAKIQFNLKNKTLIVYLDTVFNPKNEVLRIENFVLGKYLELDRGYRAYVGFTSATGCAVENHDIYSWSFCPAHPNPATKVETQEKPISDASVDIIPNPFNSSAKIRLRTFKAEHVKIEIIDLLGIEIKTLNNGFLNPGVYDFEWTPNGIDRGMYFVRVKSGTFELFNKLVFTY